MDYEVAIIRPAREVPPKAILLPIWPDGSFLFRTEDYPPPLVTVICFSITVQPVRRGGPQGSPTYSPTSISRSAYDIYVRPPLSSFPP